MEYFYSEYRWASRQNELWTDWLNKNRDWGELVGFVESEVSDPYLGDYHQRLATFKKPIR